MYEVDVETPPLKYTVGTMKLEHEVKHKCIISNKQRCAHMVLSSTVAVSSSSAVAAVSVSGRVVGTLSATGPEHGEQGSDPPDSSSDSEKSSESD